MSDAINGKGHFSEAPSGLNIQRSRLKKPFTHKTSFNDGDLIPVFVDEVLPGSSFKIDCSALIRSSTELYPVLDNAFIDLYFFFVPRRLVWKNWKRFMGENTATAWRDSQTFHVPQLTLSNVAEGSLFDYLGVPTKTRNDITLKMDDCYPRAYNLIYNEWFRNPAVKAPLFVNDGDSPTNLNSYAIRKACRYRDVFSTCLPSPQFGAPVTIPIGVDSVPVTPTPNMVVFDSAIPMRYGVVGEVPEGSRVLQSDRAYGVFANVEDDGIGYHDAGVALDYGYTGQGTKNWHGVYPNNLVAQLKEVNITVNALRQSFALQKFLERSARSGSRYFELIRSHFNVIVPDATVQRPEYLGGFHAMLNQEQVIQSSAATDESPLGTTAGISKTVVGGNCVAKSFVEHGILMGIAVVRHDRTYQQGMPRIFSRYDMTDFFFPEFSSLGEIGVLNKEIYVPGSADTNYDAADLDKVFGYQEAWYEYRYKPSMVTGNMRSNSSATFDQWHYADDYSSKPTLSDSWMQEGVVEVDRTLAVESSQCNQFLGDFYFDVDVRLPMPLYSIPGLIDHN